MVSTRDFAGPCWPNTRPSSLHSLCHASEVITRGGIQASRVPAQPLLVCFLAKQSLRYQTAACLSVWRLSVFSDLSSSASGSGLRLQCCMGHFDAPPAAIHLERPTLSLRCPAPAHSSPLTSTTPAPALLPVVGADLLGCTQHFLCCVPAGCQRLCQEQDAAGAAALPACLRLPR